MGRDQKATLQVSCAARIRCRAAARAVLSAAYVKKKMNSEVGIRDADFTYIKNIFPFEVGIRDADFGTAKVGIPCADFENKIVWKSAYAMPTLEQLKSASRMPTSFFFVYGLRFIFVFN